MSDPKKIEEEDGDPPEDVLPDEPKVVIDTRLLKPGEYQIHVRLLNSIFFTNNIIDFRFLSKNQEDLTLKKSNVLIFLFLTLSINMENFINL